MKILETMHEKETYYLVFDNMDIVGKFKTMAQAEKYIKDNGIQV